MCSSDLLEEILELIGKAIPFSKPLIDRHKVEGWKEWNKEKEVIFKPRNYQKPIMKAFKKYDRCILMGHMRDRKSVV